MAMVRIDETVVLRLVVEQLKTLTTPPVLTAIETPDADMTMYARLLTFKVVRQRRQRIDDNPDWATLDVQIDIVCDAERITSDGIYAPASAASIVASALDEDVLSGVGHVVEFDRPTVDLAGPFEDATEPVMARVTIGGQVRRQTGNSALPILN